ncbi:tetratricopeptide repeat protein [Candidatus Peregrinibacteria bacterium]|nr:tetratricopeptide repeat protein [Candidatus Peregrinibacteria bacterium]
MNKFLTILWIIIVAGSIFLAFNLFEPESGGENRQITENSDSKKPEILSQSTTELLQRGEKNLKNNEPTQAKKAFTTALKRTPNSTTLKLALARAHLNSREIEEAQKIIWQLNDQNSEVKYYKGIILILYKELDKAKNIFQELATTKLADKSQKFIDAFTTFSYYSEADQEFLTLLLAKAMTDNGEFAAAIPIIFDILVTKNNYRDAWIVLGYAYLNTGKTKDAIDAFSQAEALAANKPETLFFLGLAHAANNEIDKAIKYIEKADQAGYEPKDQIQLKLGDLYLLKDEFKKAAQKYQEVIALNHQSIDIFVRTVWLHIEKTGNLQEAAKVALQSIKYHPQKAMAYNLAGWAYTALGDYGNAKKNLEKALSLDDKFDIAHLNLGWLYEKKGNIKLAQEYYKRAYILGKKNSIGKLAAIRFNNLQINVSKP